MTDMFAGTLASTLTWVASPGAGLVIALMALATYLCRVSGYFVMHAVPLTPALQRALAALPGSIIAAAVLPTIERAGPAAAVALVAALIVMIWRRSELLALAAGLGVAAAGRAYGF